MRDYDVYFEIFGKKLKTTVLSDSEDHAKEMVKAAIIFHKVDKSKDEFNMAVDMLEGIMNALGGKPSENPTS